VLERCGTRGMLERYFKIESGERLAVNSDVPGADDDSLWEANRAGNAAVRDMLEAPADRSVEVAEPSVLDVKVELARRMLSSCICCERRCAADRVQGKTGFCGVTAESRYSSDFLHMGEEPELVPSHTIFFSGCTFECVYCQNWDIAMNARSGLRAEPAMLAAVLQEGVSQGSRNANFVGGNPDPHLWTILETIRLTGAPDLLNGVMDVYLGDFRYGNDACAEEFSGVQGYWDAVSRNFAYAFDTAEVMVRHLVLPGHLECCTRPIMEWVGSNMPGVYFNLMLQYRPEYKAGLFPTIDRRLTLEERTKAERMASEYL
jgi:putative pyruvate formate lyase activating enzyme